MNNYKIASYNLDLSLNRIISCATLSLFSVLYAKKVGLIMYMVMLVLDNPDQLDDVLTALQDAGIHGVTISDSTGAHRRQLKRVGRRYLMTFGLPTDYQEKEGHYTLFTIVPDETMIETYVKAVESITGNLDDPHTGVVSAWPITYFKGVRLDDDTESEGVN